METKPRVFLLLVCRESGWFHPLAACFCVPEEPSDTFLLLHFGWKRINSCWKQWFHNKPRLGKKCWQRVLSMEGKEEGCTSSPASAPSPHSRSQACPALLGDSVHFQPKYDSSLGCSHRSTWAALQDILCEAVGESCRGNQAPASPSPIINHCSVLDACMLASLCIILWSIWPP